MFQMQCTLRTKIGFEMLYFRKRKLDIEIFNLHSTNQINFAFPIGKESLNMNENDIDVCKGKNHELPERNLAGVFTP